MGIAILIIAVIVAVIIIASLVGVSKGSAAASTEHHPLYLERMAEAKRQAEERGDMEAVQAVIEDRYDELVAQRAYQKQAEALKNNKPTPIYDDGSRKDSSSYVDVYEDECYSIAGINYCEYIEYYTGTTHGYLKEEPTNRHDPNAIAIHHNDGHRLGYIPATCTARIRRLGIPFPISIVSRIEEDYDDYENRRFFRGRVYIVVPKSKRT